MASQQSPVSLPISLTPGQQKIVSDRGARLQVIACAGSGKTRSIAARVTDLIREGAAPESIIAFTFTEKAAAELKERIYGYVKQVMGEAFLGRLGPMYVGTIHGYCFHLLQDHVPKYGNYDVLDEHQHTGFVSRLRRQLGLDSLAHRHWESIDLFLRAADVIGNEMLTEKELAGHEIEDCYKEYRETLDRFRFLTFSQIIAQAVEALETDPAIFDRVHGPLRHLIVDEYQDINPAQEKLIELLAAAPVQLCVVGDDDQAIYQWRGSDVNNIVKFADRYHGASTHKLESNYRSRPTIVETANVFAQSIDGRLPKAMLPERKAGNDEIVLWKAETAEDEAEVIAEHIATLHREGWRYRDISVLFRSVRTSAPPMVQALTARGIPFNCGGRTGLFAHPEINHFGELFAWMSGFSWKDEKYGPARDADLNQVVAGLADVFGLPDAEQAELVSYFEDWKSYHDKSNRPVSLVGDFYKHLNMLGIAKIDPDSPEGSARLGAYARFSKILADYEHVTMRGRWVTGDDREPVYRSGLNRGQWFWQGLANYLVHYAKESYEDFSGEEIHDLDAVSILTVHQAKGLEWPILFLPALTNKRFPSTMCGRSQNWAIPEASFPADKRIRYEGSDADERRLFYVAMTRAKDIVYASTFKKITRRVGSSRYLEELAEALGLNPSHIPDLSSLPLPAPPEPGDQDDPPPLELGYSDLADYEDCGYGYRLSRIFGFERELAQELGYGKAVHHVLRHVAESVRATGITPSDTEIEEILQNEFYVPFAKKSTLANMLKNVKNLTQKYVTDWEPDLHRVWETERPFEIHFDGGILIGRADIILDQENGKADHLAIVDYKTSTDTDRDDRYARQLQVYAAAGRQEGLEIDACYVHELKSSQRTTIDSDIPDTNTATTWAAGRVAEIRSGSYPHRAKAKKCDGCDFKLVCTHTLSAD